MKSLTPLCLLATLLCGSVASAQDAAPATPLTDSTITLPATMDPAKAIEIRKLLENMGTVKLMNQMTDQIFGMFQKQMPQVSAVEWDRIHSEMNTDGLIEKIVPLYAKYYSLEDLQALNAFYATPAGQKMVAVTPELMKESMQIGQQWGQSVGMKVQMELMKEQSAGAAGTSTPPPPK